MSNLLLYCTKAKPYLYRQDDDCFELLNKLKNEDTSSYKKYYRLNNGKIVAECDFEVEELRLDNDDPLGAYWYETETLNKYEVLEKSCLTDDELFDYLGEYNEGYAIHIKNLHIFDKPKELRDYYSQGQVDWIEETELYRLKNGITTAPQNMCYAYKYSYSKNKLEKYILISIRPEWLCKILNGEKTIEVRKKVLKEMLSNDTRANKKD